MRLWNLSRLENLEPSVLVPSAELGRVTGGNVMARHAVSPVKLALQVAALSMATITVTAVGSSSELMFPAQVGVVANNAGYENPPLESQFKNRFTEDWSRGHEEELLAQMVRKKGVKNDLGELMRVVHSSQQESVSSDVPRLENKGVLEVLRRKV